MYAQRRSLRRPGDRLRRDIRTIVMMFQAQRRLARRAARTRRVHQFGTAISVVHDQRAEPLVHVPIELDPAIRRVEDAEQAEFVMVGQSVWPTRLVGFDDRDESPFFRPALTTVRLDFTEAGRRAVESVLRTLRGAAPMTIPLIQPELKVRESTGPPR
jgi:hypothetical protein